MKLQKNNKSGIIIILEGVWGSGKTNLAKAICKKYNAILVKEPNHIKVGISDRDRTVVTNWYFRAHKRNFKNGLKISQKGRVVVIERSVLSSIVFSRLVLRQQNTKLLFGRFEECLKTTRISRPCRICFVYLNIRDLKAAINKMRKNYHLEKFANPKFLKKYDRLILKYLKTLHKRKLIRFIKRSEVNKLSKILK